MFSPFVIRIYDHIGIGQTIGVFFPREGHLSTPSLNQL